MQKGFFFYERITTYYSVYIYVRPRICETLYVEHINLLLGFLFVLFFFKKKVPFLLSSACTSIIQFQPYVDWGRDDSAEPTWMLACAAKASPVHDHLFSVFKAMQI